MSAAAFSASRFQARDADELFAARNLIISAAERTKLLASAKGVTPILET